MMIRDCHPAWRRDMDMEKTIEMTIVAIEIIIIEAIEIINC